MVVEINRNLEQLCDILSPGPDRDRTRPVAIVCKLPARTVLDGCQYQAIRISQHDAVETRVHRMHERAPTSHVPTGTGGSPSDRPLKLHAARHAREGVVELDGLVREVS